MSQDQRPDRSRITELLRFQGRNRHARLGAERAHCVDDAALASIPSDISGDLASLYPLAISLDAPLYAFSWTRFLRVKEVPRKRGKLFVPSPRCSSLFDDARRKTVVK